MNDEQYDVTGNLWYDRQWNCIGVFDKTVAWDWFSVQFEETNSELMLYKVYRIKDSLEIYGGTYTDSMGKSTFLESDEIMLTEIDFWKSPASQANYPIEWEVTISKLNITTNIKAMYAYQELNLNLVPMSNFYYWEGMCKAEGTINQTEVTGNSYVEMTNRFRVR